jgi:DNA-binding response OmpR family regulator
MEYSMKIRVIDDEKDIEVLFRQKFRKELSSGTFQFLFYFSGEEALDYLKVNGTTDLVLILSDINIPGINGLDLLRIIKEQYNSSLKVYMITAYGDDESRHKAFHIGCDDYITKPLDFDQLRKCILDAE